MDKNIVNGVGVLVEIDGLEQETVAHEALAFILAEKHFFAVDKMDRAVGAVFFVGDGRVDSVVVDDAVLEYLGHRGAFVASGGEKHFLCDGELYVDRPAEEVSACAEHELGRNERIFSRSVGRRLGDETTGRCRRVLAFRQTVDLVVEQQDVDVDAPNAPDYLPAMNLLY